MVDADDHAVSCADGLLGKIRFGNGGWGLCRLLGRALRGGKNGDAKCGAGEGGQDGEGVPSSHSVLTG